jgi:phage shock protein E
MRESRLVDLSVLLCVLTVVTLGCAQEELSDVGLQELSQHEFISNPPPTMLLLDVRTSAEYDAGHIPNAVNIAHDELAMRLSDLGPGKDASIVVYCESGRRAGLAAETLVDAGHSSVFHLMGDMSEWRAHGRPVE